MSTTPGGIWFEELEGSPKIQIGQSAQGVKATREFRCAWSDWQSFAYELIGYWRANGTVPIFNAPIPFPGLPNLVVEDIAIDPFDPTSPDGTAFVDLGSATNTYESGAKVTAQYTTAWVDMELLNQPPIPAGTTLDLSGDEGADMMTIPGRTFHGSYMTGQATQLVALPEDINVGIVQPTGQHSMRWGRVPAPPWDALRELRGKVNADWWFGAPPETIMYLGFSYSRQFQILQNDGMLWSIDMKFAESVKGGAGGQQQAVEGGWNHFYFPGHGWLRITDTETDEPPYDSADLDALFAFNFALLPTQSANS